MQMLQSVQRNNSTSDMMSAETLADYGLGTIECSECGNTGWINEVVTLPSGYREIVSHECRCMKTRRSYRSMKKAGLAGVVDLYTFDRYKADTKLRRAVKDAAQKYTTTDEGWFFIGGQSGSGKTHICTAIVWDLVQRGSELLYMLWRDDGGRLKAGRNEREWFEEAIKKYRQIPLLYIDDFWKGTVTEADINLAFEILNARYNDPSLRTVISSELSIEKILSIDEAVGGRIVERARGFICKAPEENFRLRN